MIGMRIKRISVLNLCYVLKPFVKSTPGQKAGHVIAGHVDAHFSFNNTTMIKDGNGLKLSHATVCVCNVPYHIQWLIYRTQDTSFPSYAEIS